jgi:hypothetical protein
MTSKKGSNTTVQSSHPDITANNSGIARMRPAKGSGGNNTGSGKKGK